jgi:putative ABC transport system permease protein
MAAAYKSAIERVAPVPGVLTARSPAGHPVELPGVPKRDASMRIAQLIAKEIRHRPAGFGLSTAAVAAAVALFVFVFTAGEASQRETTRLMRDLGLNLRIIPRDTDMDAFWARGYSDRTMPEQYVHTLASQTGLNYAHLVAVLQRAVSWKGREVVLVGAMPELSPPDRKKPPMWYAIERGSVFVGHDLAHDTGVETGATITVLGRELRVANVLPEAGTADDVRLFGHIADVQEMLGAPGTINEIKALDCKCLIEGADPLKVLRKQLTNVLPEAKVIQIRSIARGREAQREMVERTAGIAVPFVVVIAAAWIGVLAMLNVRERRSEIGVLRALGFRSGPIAGLFLGKAVVVGVAGAIVGFAIGTGLALWLGPEVYSVTAKQIVPLYSVLGWSVVVAPLFAAVASLLPTTVAVLRDPAEALREGPA